MIKKFKLFERKISDGVYDVNLNDIGNDLDEFEQNIKDKRHALKASFDGFVKTARYSEEGDILMNPGSFAEDLAKIVLRAVNFNSYEKNQPYVDLGVYDAIEGVTEEREIISVKSTNYYSNIKDLISDTKAIKFDSLISYLIFAYKDHYTAEIKASAKQRIKKTFKDLHDAGYNFYESTEDKERAKAVIYIILGWLFDRSILINNLRAGHHTEITWNLNSLEERVSHYMDGDNFIYLESRKEVEDILEKLDAPVSMAAVYFTNEEKLGREIKKLKKGERTHFEPDILVINKTKGIPLNELFYKVLDIWADKGYFKDLTATKYLRYNDVVDIYEVDDPFEIKITIRLGNYATEYKPNRELRIRVSTDLKDIYLDKAHEEDILKFIRKFLNQVRKNPELIKDYIDLYDEKEAPKE